MNYLLTGQQSHRLCFRPITDISFEEWLPFLQREGVAKMVGLAHLATPEEQCAAWFAREHQRIADGRGGVNAVYEKATGRLAGQVGLKVQLVDGKEELEVAYSLLPQFWGNGYAAEAAQKCRDVAFEQAWCDSLISIIHVENAASMQVAFRNGMQLECATTYKGSPVNIFRITIDGWTS